MSATINAKVSDCFFATSLVYLEQAINFSISRSSLLKLATTLMAVKVSSTMPPSVLIASSLAIVDFLTAIPKTPRINKKKGR